MPETIQINQGPKELSKNGANTFRKGQVILHELKQFNKCLRNPDLHTSLLYNW